MHPSEARFAALFAKLALMNRISVIIALAAASAMPALSQAKNPFLGRWDLTLTSERGAWPQWMEIVQKDGKLDGRIQPRGGAVRPIVDGKIENEHLLVTVQKGNDRAPEVTWDLTAAGDKLAGTQKQGPSETKIAGVRAPELNRPMPKAWGAAEELFNGKDLTGWEPLGNPANSHWVVKDGTMLNEARGSNIKTTKAFQDFKLHIEALCPEHCNSGIYLRGRDEIQVGTEGGTQPSHEMGALYGFQEPKVAMPLGSGQWQTFDITLVGRHVTVVRNGVVIHDNLEIPGITGGALDSNEGEPGPFFLQGDHDGGMAYRNIRIQLPKN
jgi:hypothetical protein